MEPKDITPKETQEFRKRIRELESLNTLLGEQLQSLKQTEHRYRTIFENANDGIIIHDRSGTIYDVNPTMFRRLGYTREEFLKMNLRDLVAKGYNEKIAARVERLEQDGLAIFESADVRKDGTVMPVEVSARLVDYNGIRAIQSVVRDIQERKTAEALIHTSLKEREILVDEIRERARFHHRMHISGLESLAGARDPEAWAGALVSQSRRIKAVAFVSERIYGQGNIRNINCEQVTSNLIKHLISLHSVDVRLVSVNKDIGGVFLDVRRAATCSHILIELVSNAFQHAFPNGASGSVLIRLRKRSKNGHELVVRDDGVGISRDIDIGEPKTLGLKIFGDLVEYLGGRSRVKRSGGTEFTIRFE